MVAGCELLLPELVSLVGGEVEVDEPVVVSSGC